MQSLVLLRPRLLGIRNSLLSRRFIRRSSHREIIFTVVSLLLVVMVYQASCSTFSAVRGHAEQYGLGPDLPIALFFSLLSGMILLTGSAAALGAFYLGNDLDFLMSKPMTTTQFLLGKGIETVFQSSWMMLIFGAPTLAGIGTAYDMPWLFYLLAVLAVIPVLIIPVLLGVTVVSLVIRVIPPQKTKELLFILASVLILYIYVTAKDFMVETPHGAPAEVGQSLHALIRISLSPWLPSARAAHLLGAYLIDPILNRTMLIELLHLYGISAICGVLAAVVLKRVHAEAFSSTRSASRATRIYSARTQQRLNRVLFFIPSFFRALWAKDMRLFARDLTQGLQLIMLLGICMVYLYNFKIVHQVGEIKPEVLLWWKSTLLLCNLGMGSFIMTAICSRFVFPSLSLEGHSFWVIRSSPLSLETVLRGKFWIWFLPVGAISSIITVSGSLAIDATPSTVLITGLVSWVLCFGLVSLGIGLGAFFAHFDWESTPQVASSFGNFVYMIAGTLLVFLNLIPIAVILVISTIRDTGLPLSSLHWNFALMSTAIGVCYLNYIVHRFSLKLGKDALERKN